MGAQRFNETIVFINYIYWFYFADKVNNEERFDKNGTIFGSVLRNYDSYDK